VDHGGSGLRVAVDATPLYDARTGVGRFTEELLAGLAAADDVDAVAYAATWRGRDRLTELVPPGVATTRRAMAARPLRALWRVGDRPRIERWTGPVDVVHGTNFVVPPARAARVVTIHDLTAWHHPEMVTDDVRQYPSLVARALEQGAWVHTPSSFVRGEAIDILGADPGLVVAVPNGLTPAPGGDPDRGRRVTGGAPYVLAIGTVEPRKDLPTLVRAFDAVAADLGDLHLVVAGPDGWGVEAYEAAVAAAAHHGRIVRLGFVDEPTRADLLAGAELLALPSRYEGFGLTAGEALLAGVPVVATAAGAVPEVLGDAGLVVPVGDAEAFAAAMLQVLTDSRVAADLRRRGPDRASRFTWSAAVAGIIALWQQAAEAYRADR
jgi:glycosyltransferase involved in cell wall biosynthesis